MERECVYVCDCTAEYLQLRFRQIQEVNAKKSIEKQNHKGSFWLWMYPGGLVFFILVFWLQSI